MKKPTHIVLKINRNNEGRSVRCKARIVVGGNYQIRGIDYDEFNAPVVYFSIVRLCLSISLNYRWTDRQVDVKAAFLNSSMDRQVFVSHPVNLPKGMRHNDVYVLLKELSGLHQAPVLWYLEIDTALENMGLKRLRTENPALF